MQKHYRLYFVFVWCFAAPALSAQTNRMLRLQAGTAMAAKDWYAATEYYGRLFVSDSSSLKLEYNYAEASRQNFDQDVALKHYLHITKTDNGKRFPMTFYWIGQLLKTKGQYKEAKKWFVKFSRLKLKEQTYGYYKSKAKLEAEACDMAQILIRNPVNDTINHLDASINSKESEYAAFEKDSALYFSSLRNPLKRENNNPIYNKIYKTIQKDGQWQKVKALDTNVNATYLHNANTAFTENYREMVISRCTSKNATEYNCELYTGVLRNNKWQPFERMPAPLNIEGFSTSQPCIAEMDGKTVLFFASDRPGGAGGMDIWYSIKNNDDTYGEPVNAGGKINTPEDDITPWYVSDKQTLFFSSTYHRGLGGFDIFRSVRKNNEFTDVQNVGSPINSSYNDVYYSMNKTNTRAYLSSNRVGSFFENKVNCCNDIYSFDLKNAELPKLPDSTILVKEQMKLLVPLTLYFHNDEPDPKTTNTVTTKNYEGTYNEYMWLRQQYIKEYTTGTKGTDKEIAINSVDNFFTDSVSEGFEELKRFTSLLEKVLLKGETVKITMQGYSSPLAGTNYNENLAKRRISSLHNYFTQTKDGFFVKYINNQKPNQGKIIFEDVDLGELPASKVSDNLKDTRNSVYSPSAASERKIKIIAISFGKQ